MMTQSISVRDNMLQRVCKRPGMTKSELQRELDIGWGTVHHHLRRLESTGRVVTLSYRGQRHLFPAGLREEDQRLLVEARDATKAALLEMIAELGTVSCAEAADLLRQPFKSVQRRLTDLATQGFLHRDGTYRPRYSLNIQTPRWQ